MNCSILNYIQEILINDDYQKHISDRWIKHKKKIFIKYVKGKMNDFHYVGYMYLLYDVDVCLSIYSIIIELIDSIEKEKK
jgi:hypothetical protein